MKCVKCDGEIFNLASYECANQDCEEPMPLSMLSVGDYGELTIMPEFFCTTSPIIDEPEIDAEGHNHSNESETE